MRQARSYRWPLKQTAKPHRPRHAPDGPSPTQPVVRYDRSETELPDQSQHRKPSTPTNQNSTSNPRSQPATPTPPRAHRWQRRSPTRPLTHQHAPHTPTHASRHLIVTAEASAPASSAAICSGDFHRPRSISDCCSASQAKATRFVVKVVAAASRRPSGARYRACHRPLFSCRTLPNSRASAISAAPSPRAAVVPRAPKRAPNVPHAALKTAKTAQN